jgi:LuxR family maltose regulon positive regulatory protein
METPCLKTKLIIPPIRQELVSRPRLIERLNAGLRHKLTLVSAPAGFGKTTLLSKWASDVQLPTTADESGVSGDRIPVAWVSLDRDDNDPTRFWTYFVAALQTVYAGVGKTALAALQSRQPPPIEVPLTGLINEITTVPGPFALVLDDYHAITAQPIHDALTFLLDNLPPHMHLVLSSRADPPWPLARMRARREVTELRANDLRFTPTEVAAFLNDVKGLGLSARDIDTLDTRTEGWIAGLQLAALSMQGRGDVAAFIEAFSGSHSFILDYLMEEVLGRQPPAVQDFLLQTSILERMTGPLCDAITGQDGGQATLARLDQANLFLVSLDDERRWYRYHHLFADLLRSRLQQTRPDRVPVLHRRASEWYESAGLIEEAVAHALAGEDATWAASLVQRHAMQMIVRSQIVTLSWWIEALPDDLVRARPWLGVYRAWTQYWIGQREQAEESLQHAEQALQQMASVLPEGDQRRQLPVPAETERRHIVGHIAVIRAYNALVNEEIPRIVEMAQKALELLPEGEYMRCMAALILGGAHWGRGDVVAAQRAFAEASAAARKCGYRFLAVSAACYAGIQQAKQARLHEASATYHQATELAAGHRGPESPPTGFPTVRLGDLSREWNDLETASRELIKGVDLCAQWGQADILADGYIALARLQLAQRDVDAAANTLRKADALARKTKVDPWVLCWLDDCRLRLWLSTGDLAAAVRWAEASGLRADGELSYLHDLNHVNLARVLVAQGVRQPSGPYLDQALGLLTRLLEAAETAGWLNEAIKILILQALAFQAREDEEQALAALARALSLAGPGGYVRVFVDEGTPIGGLLRQAVARGITVDYAGRLLAALEGEVKAQPPALVEPLTEREMEVLRLLTTHLSSTQIAEELVVSVNTVRSHIKRIYGKLDVHSREDAVRRVRELGLL